MSDIDDELLALAGGDVSSDEDEEMDMSRDESRSPPPAPAPAAKKKDVSARGTATKKTVAKTSKKRARDNDESDEEGEASSAPSSPASQQSAPMDESDSESDSPQRTRGSGDEANQYPIDGLFRDYEEKEHIMGLREIEREQILAERREENERIRQNRMLRQLKVNQEKDIKKRKASAADLEDGERKTARVRTKVGETSEKMDSLRRAREERSNRKEQRERENRGRKQQSPSYRRSPGEADEDSEGEWLGPNKSKPKSRSPDVREGPPAELRDIERLRVGRSRFSEFCFYPNFDKTMTGCYVRINIGPDPETGNDVYRMAVIKGFSQGRPYAIPDPSCRDGSRNMVVDSYVKAAHGNAQREWPFFACSDRPFTEAEWERYKRVCASEQVALPDRHFLVNKIDDINKLIKYPWTEQELSEKLKRQNALHFKFSGVEREQLLRQLEHARSRGDEETAKQIQDKLDNLEIPRLAFKTTLTPKKDVNKRLTQQEKLALLNIENRKRNAEAVRKAQLKERAHVRELKMRIERGEQVAEDYSRRVTTKMKFMHDVAEIKEIRERYKNGGPGDKDKVKKDATPAAGSGASTPANGSGTPSQKATVLPHIAKLQEQQRSQAKNGLPTIHKPLMDDDIIGALDLDLDIEID